MLNGIHREAKCRFIKMYSCFLHEDLLGWIMDCEVKEKVWIHNCTDVIHARFCNCENWRELHKLLIGPLMVFTLTPQLLCFLVLTFPFNCLDTSRHYYCEVKAWWSLLIAMENLRITLPGNPSNFNKISFKAALSCNENSNSSLWMYTAWEIWSISTRKLACLEIKCCCCCYTEYMRLTHWCDERGGEYVWIPCGVWMGLDVWYRNTEICVAL